MGKLIETRDLYTEFHTFEGVVHALNGVSVVVNEGETYGLVGESGCGKSVTVRSMMRIVQAPGRIIGGKVVIFFRAEDREPGHRHRAPQRDVHGHRSAATRSP